MHYYNSWIGWIRTTDALSNETLPLMESLLSKWTPNNNNTRRREFSYYNVGKGAISSNTHLFGSSHVGISTRGEFIASFELLP
jgi:hypothetical protein